MEENKVLTPETPEESGTEGLITNPTKKQISRFVIPSIIGVFLFLCPIWVDGNINIPLGVISNWVADFIAPFSNQLIGVVVCISAIMSLICSLGKPKFAEEGKICHSLFVTSPVYLCIRVLGAVITTMVVLNAGPEWILSADTGNTMIGLMGTLIAWFFAASFLIPLLMDYGIMDYTGTLLRNLLWPLFRLPGRAAVDLLASWIGNCNVGVVLTTRQYETGYYTAREAILIATCFSATSLPFCLVIAAMMGVDQYFVPMYLILSLVGIITAAIMARVWPFRGRYKDEYYAPVGKQVHEQEPKNIKRTQWALYQAVTRAQGGPSFAGLIKRGVNMFLGIVFTLVPVTMCVGTIACCISTYTPFFDWISLPFKWYFEVLGVQEAAAAAPGAVVGFVDMFIPTLICSGIASVKTRFIVCILSLVQIIYMTEVGSIMLTSKMPVKLWDLAVIFLEKTILAIPIIVLFTNLFMPF